MATLALSVAGQFVGAAIGGPIGATLGRALGALAGSAIDNALFGGKPAPPAVAGSDVRLQGSASGGAIPRLYGWGRFTGNIIWATRLEETTQHSAGAKGTSPAPETTTTILANFAVGLCEGEVHRLGRIWADGELLETDALNFRFYRGTEQQAADSLIALKQGAANAPAYRGLCYLVFEQLDLTPFGNRIPNLSVELCRVVGELEPQITAITVIPGATEFGYDPTPRVRLVSPGATANENAHVYPHASDWSVSLDELQALCPNLKHVSLVVAWFGDDLRCGACTLSPRVESAGRAVSGAAWSVAGLSRGSARTVSLVEGTPAYGGTPSDAAVLAAIADLRARGLKVTLYPMILMDIAKGNALTDPHTGAAGQPAFPWRGRITCAPAPGVSGSPDQTATAASQLAAFIGAADSSRFVAAGATVNYTGAPDWGYRRMLLHYAHLAKLAGGVEALVIGSELRGPTTVRGAGNTFPFVTALAALAADIRGVVGPATRLTFAADWSEFSGYQPADAPGDKFFHLDALWAAPAIDAIGLDNYMPLADWRDGTDHLDAAQADSPYDRGYLEANIAGGEGFDWFYASAADRLINIRTPITDGDGEPWVWRFKDLAGWWSNPHHNRIGGVRQVAATAWVPGSKPIWFTELGCPAVDKAANQPNVFPDPKSAESARPYFSSGAPDALAQRQVLRAHFGWWRPGAPGFEAGRNPVSAIYGGRMVDPERLYLWTWDARPFPAFPNDVAAWADGANYATGHWLTGRLGALATDELIRAVAVDYGVKLAEVDAAPPLLFGLALEAVASARDILQPVLDAGGLAIHDTAAGLAIAGARPRLARLVAAESLVATDTVTAARQRPDPAELTARLTYGYFDRRRDYLSGSVTALRQSEGATRGVGSPLVLDPAGARAAAERLLADDAAASETLNVTLPPSLAAVEAGDVLSIGGQADGPFRVVTLHDGTARRAALQAIGPAVATVITIDQPGPAVATASPRAIPVLAAAQLPAAPDAPGLSRLVLAASAAPWPGQISVRDEMSGTDLALLTRKGSLGALTAPIGAGPVAVWDCGTVLSVDLYAGHLASAEPLAVLGGANRLAVETDSGEWEIIGFAQAKLVAPARYELTQLLRGQGGTDHACGPAVAGNRVLVLDAATIAVPVGLDWLGASLPLRAFAGRTDPTGADVSVVISRPPALPLAPVHLVARRERASGDIAFSWVRRSRTDTDSWTAIEAPLDVSPEAYEVTILDGDAVRRTLSVGAPVAVYPAAQQVADFSSLPAEFAFTVTQLSPLLGPGLVASGAFHG